MARAIAALLSAGLFCGVLFADDHSVNFDDHTDFSKLKSFAIREAKSNSTRPELNNPLYLKKIADAIRAALSAKGMKEVSDRPDAFIDYRIDGANLSEVERGLPVRVPDPIRGGEVLRGTGPVSVRYAQGVVTIDMVAREPKLLVWEGIYRDDESNSSKLAQKLPADVNKLLSKYPPKK